MENTGLISTPSELLKSFEPGAPAREGFIPLCVPEIRGNEWQYVKECLDTGWVSSVGSFVNRFEEGIAERAGTRYGIATASGTAALHIALLVAGVAPDDEVLVSALTFIAPANAIRYANAHPVFVDAEPVYWQMDAQRVVDFLEKQCQWTNGQLRNKATGRRVRAVMPVHILGHPVDVDPILEAARKFDLAIIEDATESLGATYKGAPVGHLGDISCFSFNGNKLITTGGGGLIATDNKTWAERSKYLTTQAKDDPVEYVHKEIGYNYRLTNVQAAMGCAQMEQIDEFIAIKRRIAAAYTEAFKDVPGIAPMQEASWASSVFWLYTVLVDEKEYGIDSRALLKRLEGDGIQARPLWQPLHLSAPYANAQQASPCETAESLNRRALSLPCSVGLSETELQKVAGAVKSFGPPSK